MWRRQCENLLGRSPPCTHQCAHGTRGDRMTITHDGRSPPKRRPGPKPRGRTVVPLTITVTHAQRAASGSACGRGEEQHQHDRAPLRRGGARRERAVYPRGTDRDHHHAPQRRGPAGQQRSHEHGRAHPQEHGHRFSRGGHETRVRRAAPPRPGGAQGRRAAGQGGVGHIYRPLRRGGIRRYGCDHGGEQPGDADAEYRRRGGWIARPRCPRGS